LQDRIKHQAGTKIGGTAFSPALFSSALLLLHSFSSTLHTLYSMLHDPHSTTHTLTTYTLRPTLHDPNSTTHAFMTSTTLTVQDILRYQEAEIQRLYHVLDETLKEVRYLKGHTEPHSHTVTVLGAEDDGQRVKSREPASRAGSGDPSPH
jgi:hypothetical protein